ncbi:MAG: hypothetical protein WAQ98_05695 [Blastocatellia bacterium]
MSNEEMERAINFLLELNAKFEVKQQILQENMQLMQENIQGLTKDVQQLTNAVAILAVQADQDRAEMRVYQAEMRTVVQQTNSAITTLSNIVGGIHQRVAKLEEKIN